MTLSVQVHAQRTRQLFTICVPEMGNHEVDLIVQRRDQPVVALEVKLDGVPEQADVRHLLWLRRQLGEDLLDAAVITAGVYAYRRSDGIAVIPAVLLGA